MPLIRSAGSKQWTKFKKPTLRFVSTTSNTELGDTVDPGREYINIWYLPERTGPLRLTVEAKWREKTAFGFASTTPHAELGPATGKKGTQGKYVKTLLFVPIFRALHRSACPQTSYCLELAYRLGSTTRPGRIFNYGSDLLPWFLCWGKRGNCGTLINEQDPCELLKHKESYNL